MERLAIGCVGLVAWPAAAGLEVLGTENLKTQGLVSSVAVPARSSSPVDAREPSGVGELGPQAASDNAFTRRMRRHQSWYRAFVLKRPYGVGPNANSTSRRGRMLTPADGERGANFLTPEIFEVTRARIDLGEGVFEHYRVLHNMLGSQPMCCNLFGPLVYDLPLATMLWRKLLGDEVASVERVAIEWAPMPRGEYLDDNTAFDAFVEYRRPDGKLSFVGIETKLTESFFKKHYDGRAYRRWMTPEAPWRPEADAKVDEIGHNQLWRDHLLAIALARHPRSPYAAGRLMLVRHSGDHACEATVAGYKGLLRAGDETFLDLKLDQLIAAWRAVVPEPSRGWLDAFALRYLDLSQSEGS